MLGWVFWLCFFLIGCSCFGQQDELMASFETCKNEFIFGKKDPGILAITKHSLRSPGVSIVLCGSSCPLENHLIDVIAVEK